MVLNVEQLLANLLLATIFSVLGFSLLFAGYRAKNWVTPGDMSGKIFHEGNVAVAVLASSFIMGLAIIIAASVRG